MKQIVKTLLHLSLVTGLQGQVANPNPDKMQRVPPPPEITSQSKSFNGVMNASLFPGGDIGAQVNAAIAALTDKCGEVIIPSGSYAQNTTIIKPRCVKLHGQSAFGTTLNWTPESGVAMVLEDTTGPNNYPEGDVADLTLKGPSHPGKTIGIYFGGDPTGSTVAPYFNGTLCGATNTSAGCPTTPISRDAFGDHQNLNRVRVTAFETAVQWGQNAWSITIDQSLITSNVVGLYFPVFAGTGDSGESISVISTRIQNNHTGLNLVGFSDFYFYGSSCDYNDTCGNVNGGHFYGMHFEQQVGPILTVTGSSQPHVEIFGGWAQVACISGNPPCGTKTDPYMFYVNSNLNPLFKIDGTFLFAGHPVDEVVHWNGSGGADQLILADLPYHANNLPKLTDASCTFWGCRIQDGTGSGAINNTNWSIHLDGAANFKSVSTSGILAGSYGPTPNTVAPSGPCTVPGTLMVTSDGHGTYCKAGDRVWTRLY
jgi:hypothetical protein